MVFEPILRFSQAGLSAHRQVGRSSRARRWGPRRTYAPKGRVLYAPTTETVLKRPLLIVPPWINKFYILDLTPEKSFIKWCVDQGLTVFVISWVNPDARLAQKSFEDYMREGPLQALDIVRKSTGEKDVHAVGYCAGGT